MRAGYVNLIPTVAGGTHESGLEDGLFRRGRRLHRYCSLFAQGRQKLMPDDVFSRASFVLSARCSTAVQGQIKAAGNAAMRCASCPRMSSRRWALAQPACRPRQKARRAGDPPGQTRQRASQKVEKRRARAWRCCPASSPTAKAATRAERDLSSSRAFRGRQRQDGSRQGDSGDPCRCAARCSTRGRSRRTASSPTTRSTTSRWRSASTRTGRPTSPTSPACAAGRSASCRTPTSTARIQVLLLTLFFRHFPKLIERGHIRRQAAALSRRRAGARPARSNALDDGEPRRAGQAAQGGGARGLWSISRFKGLGEMNAEQLGHDAQPGRAPAAAGGSCGQLDFAGTTDSLTEADGQGRGAGAARADGTARRRGREVDLTVLDIQSGCISSNEGRIMQVSKWGNSLAIRLPATSWRSSA